MRKRFTRISFGFTMVELLIIVALISVIAVIVYLLLNPKEQIYKAWDVKRKENLASIRNTLESYYSDKTNYPSTDEMCYGAVEVVNGNCYCKICASKNENKDVLSGNICDPQSPVKDYLYQFDCGLHPQWYRVCATLFHVDDIEASTLSGSIYNYGVSSGNTIPDGCLAVNISPTSVPLSTTPRATLTNTPTPIPSTSFGISPTLTTTPTTRPPVSATNTPTPTQRATATPTPTPRASCLNNGNKYCLDNGFCNICGTYENCMNNCSQKYPLYNDYLCGNACYY